MAESRALKLSGLVGFPLVLFALTSSLPTNGDLWRDKIHHSHSGPPSRRLEGDPIQAHLVQSEYHVMADNAGQFLHLEELVDLVEKLEEMKRLLVLKESGERAMLSKQFFEAYGVERLDLKDVMSDALKVKSPQVPEEEVQENLLRVLGSPLGYASQASRLIKAIEAENALLHKKEVQEGTYWSSGRATESISAPLFADKAVEVAVEALEAMTADANFVGCTNPYYVPYGLKKVLESHLEVQGDPFEGPIVDMIVGFAGVRAFVERRCKQEIREVMDSTSLLKDLKSTCFESTRLNNTVDEAMQWVRSEEGYKEVESKASLNGLSGRDMTTMKVQHLELLDLAARYFFERQKPLSDEKCLSYLRDLVSRGTFFKAADYPMEVKKGFPERLSRVLASHGFAGYHNPGVMLAFHTLPEFANKTAQTITARLWEMMATETWRKVPTVARRGLEVMQMHLVSGYFDMALTDLELALSALRGKLQP